MIHLCYAANGQVGGHGVREWGFDDLYRGERFIGLSGGWLGGYLFVVKKLNPREAGLIRIHIKTGLINDLISQAVYFSEDLFELGCRFFRVFLVE